MAGRRFAAVLCHGVLGYLPRPEPVVEQLCRCAADGGIVSVMAGNAAAMAVRPALERRWDDALAAFDARAEVGVLGLPTRADTTVRELGALLRGHGVRPVRWYGVWLFVDWLDLGGVELDPGDARQLAAAAVELEAGRRIPTGNSAASSTWSDGRVRAVLRPDGRRRPRGSDGPASRRMILGRDGPAAHRAAKYFASGWCATSADVDCSGCSWNSSDNCTPIRSGSSSAITLVCSDRSGHAG